MKKIIIIYLFVFFIFSNFNIESNQQNRVLTQKDKEYPEDKNKFQSSLETLKDDVFQQIYDVSKKPVPVPNDIIINKSKSYRVVNATQDVGLVNSIDLEINWNGPQQNGGYKPADCDIAVGPNHIVAVVNSKYCIYDRTNSHNPLKDEMFRNFFTNPPPLANYHLFDPKVIYDPWAKKWVILALEWTLTHAPKLPGFIRIAVSQTDDPTGAWWHSRFKANIGTTTPYLWADWPGLGFTTGWRDSGEVAIAVNIYEVPEIWQYPKVIIFKKSTIYNGQLPPEPIPAHLFRMKNDFHSTIRSIKPSQNLNTWGGDKIYMLNLLWSDNKDIVLHTFTDPFGTYNYQERWIDIGKYSDPPPASKPGGGTLKTGQVRLTGDVIYGHGLLSGESFLYTSFHEEHKWPGDVQDVSVIRYLKLNAETKVVLKNERFGRSQTWYMYPDVAPQFNEQYWAGDSVGISFTVSSNTINPEAKVAGFTGTNWIRSVQVRPGGGGFGNGNEEFGDYSGIHTDLDENGLFWSFAEVGKPNLSDWGTGIGCFALFDYPPIGIQNLAGSVPNDYELSQNYPNPFNPKTTIRFNIPKSSHIKLIIYDILGKQVAAVINKKLNVGSYKEKWDGSNYSSGVYFYKLVADDFIDVKKMVLIK